MVSHETRRAVRRLDKLRDRLSPAVYDMGEEFDTYEHVRELLRTNRTPEPLAIALAEWMEQTIYRDLPLSVRMAPIDDVRRDLIGFALERVDWRQIAEHLLALHPT